MASNVLTWMIFVPLVGALVVLCLPRYQESLIKGVAAAFTVPPLLLAIWLFQNFDRTTSAMQFVTKVPWVRSFNIEYFVGVDGISVTMVLLTALLSFICIFASWGINRAVKAYFALFLLLDAAMM